MLINMLFYISILGIFMLLIAYGFDTTMRTLSQTRQWHEKVMAVDGAIDMLREDVWNARNVAVLSPGHMRIDVSENEMIIWKFELPVEEKDEVMAGPESGHFVRMTYVDGENIKSRHFPMAVSSLRFKSDQMGNVIVQLEQPGKDRFNSVHLSNLGSLFNRPQRAAM